MNIFGLLVTLCLRKYKCFLSNIDIFAVKIKAQYRYISFSVFQERPTTMQSATTPREANLSKQASVLGEYRL